MHDRHVFLFEMVDKGKNVILYGLGNVGKAYIRQIETTQWCNIVGVCDKEIKESLYTRLSVEQIAEGINFDYIIIAIDDIEISSQVYEELIKIGINKAKILNLNMRDRQFPYAREHSLEDDKIRIGIVEAGGFGDALIDMVFIKKLKELVSSRGKIIFITRNENYFKRFSEIDEVIDYETNKNNIVGLRESLDLVFRMHSVALILKFNEEKVRLVSEQLYLYCKDCLKFYKELFSNRANNYRFTKYALLLGKNRIEHTDIHGILGIKRTDKFHIPIYEDELRNNVCARLSSQKYITVNRDTGYNFDIHTKLWPTDHYIQLLKDIKRMYPEIYVVLIGEKADRELIPFVDEDLTGRTSLSDMNVILKNSLLHIGSEGGLIHLRHFLNGKSMVFFGPTDVRVFGYDENINLNNGCCGECCAWLTDNWIQKCIRGDVIPRCMERITPKEAFEAFESYIREGSFYK